MRHFRMIWAQITMLQVEQRKQEWNETLAINKSQLWPLEIQDKKSKP